MKSRRVKIDPPAQGRINFDVPIIFSYKYGVPNIINRTVSYPIDVHYLHRTAFPRTYLLYVSEN